MARHGNRIYDENMGERFNIRATTEDLERWKAAAAEDGLAVGPWLRMLANRELKRRIRNALGFR